jgi:hypothetical protein
MGRHWHVLGPGASSIRAIGRASGVVRQLELNY